MNKLDKIISEINIDELVVDALKRVEFLLKEEKLLEATTLAKQILKVQKNNKGANQLYAIALYAQKEYQKAIDVILANEMIDESYNNLALCYLQTNQVDKALNAQLKAVELKPHDCNFWNNLALIYRVSNQYDKSIEAFQKSLNLNPNNTKTLEGLGSIYGFLKQIDKSIETFERAIKIDRVPGVHVDLAYAYFLNGDWQRGWEHYEYRLEHWHKTNRGAGVFYELFPKDKKWNGQDLKDKIVIVYCEQGIGDYINFIKFVPLLSQAGAKVYIEVDAALGELFKTFGELITTRTNERYSSYDYHCSVLSLPYLFNLTEEQLGGKAYLKEDYKFDYSEYKGKYKIGIVWAGNPAHPNDVLRSCYLSKFREISKLNNVQLFSLQKDKRNRMYAKFPDLEINLAEGCHDMNIVDLAPALNSFNDTAKAIQGMDLIITVDTSVAHLAGALGKETWVLIPFNPDWRWKSTGEKTIWYDSMTLFRQTAHQDWDTVFDAVKIKLGERL
jgi:tetratricopeptide (TPR) repeat protein